MNPWVEFQPLDDSIFVDAPSALRALREIAASGASEDLLTQLWSLLHEYLGAIDSPDDGVRWLARFVEVSRSPTSLLALFERDPQALPALLQVLSTSNSIAELLISDPESFDLLRASDGRPTSRELLSDELGSELRNIASIPRAAVAIRRYAGREMLRIAYGEFVRGLPPDRAARQISHLTDAVLSSALEFTIQQTAERLHYPQRIDGTKPEYSIVALGNYGGEEIGYDSPLDLLLLCDQIDRKNESHLKFNRQIASGLINLLGSNRAPVVSINLRFVPQPGEDMSGSDTQRLSDYTRGTESASRQIDFHDAVTAAAYFERENQTSHRLAFVKARVAAGDRELGDRFLKRIEPWVYHRLLSRSEIADIRVLRRKLEKRALAPDTEQGTPIADCPGGRRDIELTIQFLQVLHG
ncbi:MAG: glutamate-ammonia-ligase adenylyltransferase, partial [Rhodopirellula sp. JB053]